jgi:hypothetical protein
MHIITGEALDEKISSRPQESNGRLKRRLVELAAARDIRIADAA